ncbi:polysaccharide deacetylase family protein [Rhizobium paknamense]|uniref:Polysaccharide deacetylase n=1 Tax=Rhizobium paknamense TaxID=1206817 RepID=A0ABU0ICZ3_9HYPH|nr:polysaccharide deacetylase family protein [Rhizobium paknamense]MDQ0456120.1 hypothetical protein [Rhizobium paknamense]
MNSSEFRAMLDHADASGRRVRFWLRDDDAVEPGPALERLLGLCRSHAVPVTLAVIPEQTGEALAERLCEEPQVTVAVHGWSHCNHAGAGEKKQELGAHRPLETVAAELAEGFVKLRDLHEGRFVPMLVPPWNRITPALLPLLPSRGFRALSTFGAEKPVPDQGAARLRLLNTHVDVMDWHGTRGGRPAEVLFQELAGWMDRGWPVIGLLTHHLVHDEAVWRFLEQLFSLTAGHSAVEWIDFKAML